MYKNTRFMYNNERFLYKNTLVTEMARPFQLSTVIVRPFQSSAFQSTKTVITAVIKTISPTAEGSNIMTNNLVVVSNQGKELTIDSGAKARQVLDDLFEGIEVTDKMVADILYAVKAGKLYDGETYTDSKGKTHGCKNLMDYAKTLSVQFNGTQVYNKANAGEVRAREVYYVKTDDKGVESPILGRYELDEDGERVIGSTYSHLLNGEPIKDGNGKTIDTPCYLYNEATNDDITLVDGIPTLAPDIEPIVDLDLTKTYKTVIDLYSLSALGEVLYKVPTARGILRLHTEGKITPKMSVKELKAVIEPLVNPVKATTTESKAATDSTGESTNESKGKGKVKGKGKAKPLSEFALQPNDGKLICAFFANNHNGVTTELETLIRAIKVAFAIE